MPRLNVQPGTYEYDNYRLDGHRFGHRWFVSIGNTNTHTWEHWAFADAERAEAIAFATEAGRGLDRSDRGAAVFVIDTKCCGAAIYICYPSNNSEWWQKPPATAGLVETR